MMRIVSMFLALTMVEGQQVLDTHDASKCSEDDGSQGSAACCGAWTSYCDSFYEVKKDGSKCSGDKDVYTCVCTKDNIFCNENWGNEWDAEWDQAGEDLAKAAATALIMGIVIPIVACICICICCCYCNKTCCFEKKQEPVVIMAPQQQ